MAGQILFTDIGFGFHDQAGEREFIPPSHQLCADQFPGDGQGRATIEFSGKDHRIEASLSG
jgi:hypothetical protein